MQELLDVLEELEKNSNYILAKYKQLENECSKNQDTTDCGLLGNLEDLVLTTENGLTYSINEGRLILNGTNRYANLAIIYKEKKENCIPNVQGQYMLHIEGYKEKGCTNAYVNSTTHLILEDKFNIDIKMNASWQRTLRAAIFINNTNGQNSKMVITSLKLTKAE